MTLSYFPDNAAAASRVRDLGGNEADGFAGLEVRNDTPQGPHVEGAAFAEAAKTYAIGDTIEVAVTFSESVRVRAAPTIGLAIGSATRKAVWKAGQAAGTVHRFAYTVAQGDLDTDGIVIRRNTLALGGGTIATVAKSGTVDLRHDSLPRHRDRTVDGVRPAVKAGAEGRRHARPGARADVDRRAGIRPPCPQARADSRSRLEERWSLRCARSRSTGRR